MRLRLLLVLLLLTQVASADAPSAAEVLFRQGNELLRSHRYAEAVQRYRASFALSNSAKALLNLGIALTQLDRNVEAEDALTAYLADPSANPGKRAFAASLLAAARARVVRLRVEGDEPGVAISVDSKPVGTTPIAEPIRLDAGRHTVVARKQGRLAVETIALTPSQQQATLRIRLGAARPAPPPRRPAARSSGASAQRVLSWISGSLGVVALGVGTAYGLDARAKWREAKDHCPDARCVASEDLNRDDEARTSARISTAAFVTGGAALIGAAALWFTAPDETEARALHAGVALGSGNAALLVGGGFR
jgi:tetratricopeptide (TPR) repeat protein